MKLAFQLAYKNIRGSGLRTWLNVGVLSFTFVVIIFYNGMIDGWNEQARIDATRWEYGNGQLLNENYDPSDPFSLLEGHGILPKSEQENLVPILIHQATIYLQGRMLTVQIKGIKANQDVLDLPTKLLNKSNLDFPIIIGQRMARAAGLKVNDEVLVRWRDKNGTFDSQNATVVGIFNTNIATVDANQLWMSIQKLWNLTGLENQSTLFIANTDYVPKTIIGWRFESKDELLSPLTQLINSKKISGSIIYLLLLGIGLLAIFDTQVLSVFRRQKEIGTYIALGMTRLQVVGLFTAEGSMYSILGSLLGCIYGIPLFIFMSKVGIGMPVSGESVGIILSDRIYPVYGVGLILSTLLIVVFSATIVSFLPARKIAKMNPVEALKGKIQ